MKRTVLVKKFHQPRLTKDLDTTTRHCCIDREGTEQNNGRSLHLDCLYLSNYFYSTPCTPIIVKRVFIIILNMPLLATFHVVRSIVNTSHDCICWIGWILFYRGPWPSG